MSGQKIVYVDEFGNPIPASELHLYEIVAPEQTEQINKQVVNSSQKVTRRQSTSSQSKPLPKRRATQAKTPATRRKKRPTEQKVDQQRPQRRTTTPKSKGKKRQKKKRRLKVFPFLFIFLCVVASIFVFNSQSFDIIVMGLDTSLTREDEYGRTDSLMAVHVDPLARKASIVSIPRDTYTPITCLDDEKDKINHAHAYGGTDCTIQTVDQFLEMDTEYYFKTNFEGVMALVESIGGIPITVQGTFCEQDSQDQADAYCFNEGEQRRLNGEEALAYARHRKTDGDEMRQVRQQQVLTAMVKEVLKPSVFLTRMPAFLQALDIAIETNVPMTKLIFAAPWFLIKPTIESLRIEGEGAIIDDIWYLIPDEASVAAAKEAV